MNVLLLHIDGKIPNIALMRVASHYRERGDSVELRYATSLRKVEPHLWDNFDRVYASLIFERSRPIAKRLLQIRPDAIVGGTGWDETVSLESVGITGQKQDYSDYPKWRQSIGFSQRGCRFKCSFCKVPRAEGSVRKVATVLDIWRGDPWPRELILLDNDFFGWPGWRTEIEAIRSNKFKVSFNQGINARAITDEAAAAIASVDFRDDQMKDSRIYTAWDSREDEDKLFRGLSLLTKYGIHPDQIMVYMLVGYWPGETHDDREYRRRRLREFGARPYPMPFIRSPELVAFQRWVVRRIDLKMSWQEFSKIGCRPERIGHSDLMPLFDKKPV